MWPVARFTTSAFWTNYLLPEAGAFYLLDGLYLDFARLQLLTQDCALFVMRARKDIHSFSRHSRRIDISTGLR
jgi:hypothetical protein